MEKDEKTEIKNKSVDIKSKDLDNKKVAKEVEKNEEKKKDISQLLKIKKLKYKGDSELPKNNLHDSYIIPNHPFRAMMLAPSKGGKSTLICNLLCKSIFYKNFFDNVFVFSPTLNIDMTYEVLKEKKVAKNIEFYDELNVETLEGLVDEMKKSLKEIIDEDEGKKADCPQTLFIFDDCVGDKALLNSKVFKDIFIYGRHLCCSSIIGTQAYKAFPLKLRNQLSNVFIFDLPAREVKNVTEELCPTHVGPKEFMDLLNMATEPTKDDPKPFLHINNQHPDRNLAFRRNLDTVLAIKAAKTKSLNMK